MLMLIVVILFNLLAYRGYPWSTLFLAIPLALLAGLLDSPPYLEELRIFASDFLKVLTKAILVGTSSFALSKFLGRVFRKRPEPVPQQIALPASTPRRSGGSLLDWADRP